MKAYNLENLNFMIVDDNRHMRFIVKTILHGLNVRSIMEADDGSDALKLMRTFSADVVICDWLMEPLDGIEFVRLVRTGSDSQNPYVPILMLTGYTETSRVKEARDAGVNEFLAKPIAAAALYQRLIQIIDRPRAFIKTRSYTGPNRRRRSVDFIGQERRANADKVMDPAFFDQGAVSNIRHASNERI